MFRKFKDKREIKKNALQFTDKIDRLGDLFKSYGFDIIYRNRIWKPNHNFFLRLQGDNVLELIGKLGKDLYDIEGFYQLHGKFKQEIKIWNQTKAEEIRIDIKWKYDYNGYSLKDKLNILDVDIRRMEQIIYKKEEVK